MLTMLFSMGKRQSLKNLKTSLAFFFISSLWFSGYAQSWIITDSVEIEQRISAFAIDQNSMIYLGTEAGNILRFDERGNLDQLFSEINYSSVTIIEPWNRLKVFLFFRENQVMVFLDRFSTYTNETRLNSLDVGFGKLATIGVDNSFWVLESYTNELRKYSTTGSLIFSTPLGNLDLENASHIRSYKNLLIILDAKKGVFLFDQFGNLIAQLAIEGARYFHLHKGRIITYDGKQIIEFNPFKPSEIIRIEGPSDQFIGLLKSEDKYFFIKKHRIYHFILK